MEVSCLPPQSLLHSPHLSKSTFFTKPPFPLPRGPAFHTSLSLLLSQLTLKISSHSLALSHSTAVSRHTTSSPPAQQDPPGVPYSNSWCYRHPSRPHSASYYLFTGPELAPVFLFPWQLNLHFFIVHKGQRNWLLCHPFASKNSSLFPWLCWLFLSLLVFELLSLFTRRVEFY